MRGLITSFITLQDIQKQVGICTETLLVLFEIFRKIYFHLYFNFVVNITKRVKINITSNRLYLKLLNVNLRQIKPI